MPCYLISGFRRVDRGPLCQLVSTRLLLTQFEFRSFHQPIESSNGSGSYYQVVCIVLVFSYCNAWNEVAIVWLYGNVTTAN